MMSLMFPYWEEGNHDGHKKGRSVVHLGDRSFQDVRLYVLFLGHQKLSLECPGAVFSPLTLHQYGIVRPSKGKTWHHPLTDKFSWEGGSRYKYYQQSILFLGIDLDGKKSKLTQTVCGYIFLEATMHSVPKKPKFQYLRIF